MGTAGSKGIHIERQTCFEPAQGGNKKGRKERKNSKAVRTSENIAFFTQETHPHHIKRSFNFKMSFWYLQIHPKNELKQVDLRYHNSS